MTADEARELVESVASESPDLFRLAKALALAVRVETELVRAARLGLMPEVDAGTEADLWFSPLVQTQSSLAMVFEPEVLAVLREKLAEDQELLGRAWGLLRDFHAESPPALRWEEELTWLALSDEGDVQVIERRLQSVLVSIRDGKREGLARWALRALPTLPEKARNTEAARRLSVVAGVQTGVGPVLSAVPRKGAALKWLSEVTARSLDHVKVGVRLLKNEAPALRLKNEALASDYPLTLTAAQLVDALNANTGGALSPSRRDTLMSALTTDVMTRAEVLRAVEEESGFARAELQPVFLELSYPPAGADDTIEVPDTYRLLLEVSWQDGNESRVRQVSLLPQETQRVPVGYGEVTVRTALGDLNAINPHFEFDLFLAFNEADGEWMTRLVSRLGGQRRIGPDSRGKPLKSNTSTLDDPSGAYENYFRRSRKVGFVISLASAEKDWETIERLAELRPEPPDDWSWLIPIYRDTRVRPPRLKQPLVVDFSSGQNFEDGFRSLWLAITGERLPLPRTRGEKKVSQPSGPIEVFFSYAHEDEDLRDQLETHLAMLRLKGVIGDWHDRIIVAGQDWGGEIDEHLDSADIILLLVSSYFLASDYCYDIEVKRAMQRHEAQEAVVIPIILRPCDWTRAPFGKLQALPKGAEAVTLWTNLDQAFLSVVVGIRGAAEELLARRDSPPEPPGESVRVTPPHAIPRPPALGFVSRRDAQGRDIVGRLKEELAPGRNQLVTLSGPGGIGKTTLAAEAARALLGDFRGRVVWSSTLARADFTLPSLLDDIATQLGRADLRTLAPGAKEEQVRALVADPPALVVLDSYEIIAADTRRDIEAWFAGAQCSALFTSRPRIDGTVFVPVSAMSREEAGEFLEKLVEQTQDPQIFSAEVRQRVYETAEANPLVMQWVMAQIGEGQELDTVLEELARGEGDAAERVFDRSFNLPQLGDDGRAALLALSLFVPSATREALAEVAGFGDDRKRLNDGVKNLHALWLIKAIDENRRLTVEGLTRSLAGACLSKDERAGEFRQRYVAYFLRYAQAHAQPVPEDFDALEVEKDNVLNAMDAAFEMGDWDSVVGIRYALGEFLDLRGYWDEAIRYGEQALKAAHFAQNEGQVAGLSHNLAVIFQNRGELEEARRLYGESLEIKKKLGNERGVAVTLHLLGRLVQEQGELEEARWLYGESLEISRRLGDQNTSANVLHDLGGLAHVQGVLEEARRLYGESLEIAKKLGNQRGIAVTLHQLGRLARDQDELEEARQLYNESLEISWKLGDQNNIAMNLSLLGDIALRTEDLTEARRLSEESLAIFNRLRRQDGVATVLSRLGELARREGDRDEAARLFREALRIFESLRSPAAEGVRRALASLESESDLSRPR